VDVLVGGIGTGGTLTGACVRASIDRLAGASPRSAGWLAGWLWRLEPPSSIGWLAG